MADLSRSFAAVRAKLKSFPLYAPAQAEGLDNLPWEAVRFRVLVVRLSPFRDAARSTGHLFLHRMVRQALGKDAFVDFAFFPSKPDRAVLDAAGLPWLAGIASGRTAEDFDAVLVSCSYALELLNLPLLLLRSGLPLRAGERRKASGARPLPPILVGGSNALASQGLLFPDGDSFADGIFFGEGEDGGSALVSLLADTVGKPAAERMDRIEESCPAFYASCKGAPDGGRDRRVIPGRCMVSENPPLLDVYPLLNSEEASTARLQISWGCPSFCSFCFEGWERKPYRELPRDRVLETARKLKRGSGASTADLYSFNFNAHEDALELLLELNRIFDRVNMMSQRADLLARTPGMLASELAAEKRSFTVGVEGVSAGMRSYYSKDLSGADLRSLMEKLLREKIRELKLFFILSGSETEADLAEFRAFCSELRSLADDRHPGLRALFSFGYLVRMPFTPLGAEALALDRGSYRRVESAAREAVEAAGFEFRLAGEWDEYVVDQLLVSGGYALAEGLEAAARAGCAFDLRIEGDPAPHLIAALRKSGELDRSVSADALTGPLVEKKGPDYRPPLSFVDTQVSGPFREKAFGRAADREDTRSCLGDYAASCLGCGACSDEEERNFLVRHRVKPASGAALPEQIARVVREKRRGRPRYFAVRLPDSFSGAVDEFLGACLLARTLAQDPSLEPELLRIEEALRSSPEWRERLPAAFTGSAVLAVYGAEGLDEAAAAAALSAALGSPAEVLASFDPGSEVAGLDVAVELPDGGPEAAAARVRRWLAALRLAATERKTADGRIFEIAPKDRRKRMVETVELRAGRLLVRGGPKLDLGPLLPKQEDRNGSILRIERLRLAEQAARGRSCYHE